MIPILMIASIIPSSGTVKAIEAQDFDENFDDGNLIGWTINCGAGNTVAIANWPVVSHPYCLNIKKVSTNGLPARATSSSIPVDYAKDYWLLMKFRMEGSVTQRGMLIADDGRLYLWIPFGGTLEFIGANSQTIRTTYSPDSYLFMQVHFKPSLGSYDVYLYRFPEFDWIKVVSSLSFKGAPLGKLSVGTDATVSTSYYGQVYFDDIRYVGNMQFFYDNFDDGSISDWTKQLGSYSVIEPSTAKYVSPSYSLHVKYGGKVARATSPVISGNYMYYDYTVFMQYYPVMEKYVLVMDNGHMLIYDMVGKLYSVKSDGSSVQIGTVTNSAWNKIELRAHPGANPNFEVVINGVSKGFFGLKSNTAAASLTVGSEPSPGSRTSGEAYWDDIRVLYSKGLPDADGDGISDAAETAAGTDPNGYQKWAVIVVGGFGDDLQSSFESTGDSVYSDLMRFGYTDDHVYYLTCQDSSNIWRDADGDGDVDVDGTAHDSSVQTAIKTWLHNNADSDDRIFINFIDHGGQSGDSGYLCLHKTLLGTENVYDYQVDSWLDYLTTNKDFDRLVFVIDCCYAGNWIHGTDTVAGQNRIIIAGSAAHATGQVGFSTALLGDVFTDLISIEDAYYLYRQSSTNCDMSDMCNPATNPTGEVYIIF